MRILLGFSYYKNHIDQAELVLQWVNRLRKAGFDVDPYPLTINPPANPILWKKLDRLWKLGDKSLLSNYEQLALKLEDYDVFLNWNGIHVHPEFVAQLPTINVFGFFDDPESSHQHSKPTAAAYDICMVGNIAELDTYRSWGCRNVHFWPNGFRADEYDPTLTEERIWNDPRPIDISLLCEKKYFKPRIARLDQYAAAFPDGHYYGAGWPMGFLNEEEKIPLHLKTKIGPNFHNSTGPINFRVWTLPANGVMQICDNKSYLGKVFELGKEVVGFDTTEEAIELTRYYLAHEEERKKIAVAGWKRTIDEYNEIKVFGLVSKYLEQYIAENNSKNFKGTPVKFLHKHRKNTVVDRTFFVAKNLIKKEKIPR